jgi:putative membrane protein
LSEPAPRDPGLQQERTALAWRRTGLALLVGALTIGRLTLSSFGPVVVVPTLLVSALAGFVAADALRARRLARAHPGEPAFSILADGRLPGAMALVLGSLALAEVASALSRLL